MRPDMEKVLIERPRHQSIKGGAYPRAKLNERWGSLEDRPSREAMGRAYGTKDLSDNLAPLQRFLASNVGRPWRLVHHEMAQHLSSRTAVQQHVFQHLREMLVESVVLVDGQPHGLDPLAGGYEPVLTRGSWRRFYVCPRTGLLREAPRRSWAPDFRGPVRDDPTRRRVLSADRELHRLGDDWFEVVVAAIPTDEVERLSCRDCIMHASPMKARAWDASAPAHWRDGRYAVRKRQLSTRELTMYGLRGARR